MTQQNQPKAKGPKPVAAANKPAAAPKPAPVPVRQPTVPAKMPPAPSLPQAPPLPPAAPGMAKPAQMRRRHWGVMLSFLLAVVTPLLVAGWYLYTRAADQYASTVGFSVRTEDISSAIDLLGGLGDIGGGSSSDTDILYEFIQSQELVREIDDKLDLKTIYSRPGTSWSEGDPVFAYDASGTIEDLTAYWGRMVRIVYDSGAGLIEIRANAFTPDDAQTIARAVFDQSALLVNDLSAIAREDTTRYAREELDRSIERLKVAREAMTRFRSLNQIVDPEAEVGLQTGLMGALQQQLSDALIQSDLLRATASGNDPRLREAERRVEIIRHRIDEERLKMSGDEGGAGDFAGVVGEYERLAVDREFAEQTYLAALAAYDSALTEAQRKSRYLAAYVKPTLAERAQYPQRALLLALLGLFLFFSWAISVLAFYAVKDRR